jgi:hypothetical protein
MLPEASRGRGVQLTRTGSHEGTAKRRSRVLTAGEKALPVLLLLLIPTLFVVALGVRLSRLGIKDLKTASRWLDPMFFNYNLALAALAILILPTLTFLYVTMMEGEKRRRLIRDLPKEDFKRYWTDIDELVKRQFSFESYLAPMVTTMLVVGCGAFIILLMKPCFPAVGLPTGPEICNGVDYGRGGNVLLLGPFVEKYGIDRAAFYHQIAISLAAFQFGFLGAYVYFLGSLTRDYFILDLSCNTFVAGSVRMVTSSLLALVISFAIPSLLPDVPDAANSERFLRILPVLAFCIGYFPERGFLWLDQFSSKFFGVAQRREDERTSLACISGMSLAHQMRLDREGIDNLENLSHVRPAELAVRTGFSYRQLKAWVEEAVLRRHMGEEYDDFFKKTGIATADQLDRYCQPETPDAAMNLESALGPQLFAKTRIAEHLIHTRPRSEGSQVGAAAAS